MDQLPALALVGAAMLGIIATLTVLWRERRSSEAAAKESPFATSTEGEKRCPSCGMGNLVMDANCVACGAKLPG